MPSALGVPIPNYWTIREIPHAVNIFISLLLFLLFSHKVVSNSLRFIAQRDFDLATVSVLFSFVCQFNWFSQQLWATPGKVHALPDCLFHIHHIHLTVLPTYLPQALTSNFSYQRVGGFPGNKWAHGQSPLPPGARPAAGSCPLLAAHGEDSPQIQDSASDMQALSSIKPLTSLSLSWGSFSLFKHYFGHAVWPVGSLVPRPGVEPEPHHWKLRDPTTGPPGNFPLSSVLKLGKCSPCTPVHRVQPNTYSFYFWKARPKKINVCAWNHFTKSYASK